MKRITLILALVLSFNFINAQTIVSSLTDSTVNESFSLSGESINDAPLKWDIIVVNSHEYDIINTIHFVDEYGASGYIMIVKDTTNKIQFITFNYLETKLKLSDCYLIIVILLCSLTIIYYVLFKSL